MAKKVFLQDQNEKLLPITRGELVLDSSGKEAFHSSEFLASTTQPGLMSAEDKIRLNLLKAQSIPLIEGPDTDTTSKWTGTYEGITEYSHGMSIWYVPNTLFLTTTTLNINNLGEKSIKIAGGGKLLTGHPNLLVYDSISNSWFFCDYDTNTHLNKIPIFQTVNRDDGYIHYYTDLSIDSSIFTSNSGYIVLCNPTTISLENITKIVIGISTTILFRKPVVFTSTTGEMVKGYYIAYYDGETVYINTDGVIPGIIEKAKIAETVEWNEVEGDNEDVSIGESSVTNSLYLYTHNLTNVSKKPSEYKNQYLTAWFSKTDMPITQTCSGINISSSSTNVNWQLCSQASNTYDRAYDRLWFRSGIGESWNPWQQVAFIHDLNTFKVKQDPVEDPTAEGVSTTFIDSISQDENGKITVTKKTVQNTGSTSQSIPVASETDLGGIRLGYITDSASRNYKVQVNQTGDAYVNVPWVPGESGDTKNTAGATNNESDLFIIGSLDQSDNPQTYSNANIKISGNAIKASGGFYQESDERLKDFKDDIQVDLEQLSQLPKKHFTWKNDSKKETQIGTSAQELQKLYPELVKEDSNGTLSVAYDKLSIIALKAIDELYKRNIELEKRIQELEKK